MKVLNLYSGIGGNRKLWTDCDVTAVELNPDIANIYSDFFPNDTVIIGDAHEYLLKNYDEYDFIWASPPCPTHSKLGKLRALNNDTRTGSHLSKPRYPDMNLYAEIIFLKNFFKGKWAIENVKPYYEPLIPPIAEIQRHYFWSNFYLPNMKNNTGQNIDKGSIGELAKIGGFDLTGYKVDNKKTILRNCVIPEVGLYIFNAAFKQKKLIQEGIFL